MEPTPTAQASTRDMATPGRLLRQLIRTVPQWYEAEFGAYSYTLTCEWEELTFHSLRPLTPNLTQLYDYAKESLSRWNGFLPTNPRRTFFVQIRQTLAIRWLTLICEEVNWTKVINHLEELSFRTYENLPISINLIISAHGEGQGDITEPGVQKIFNTLGTSPFTFLKCDKNLNFMSYGEIQLDEIKVDKEYKFNPEFLQPLISALGPDEYGVHLSEHGDIVFVSMDGMIASFRKGEWFIYDARTFRSCIGEALGATAVGSNLYQVLFDLSYQRHGALLVFDPENCVAPQIVNKESMLDPGQADVARRCLMPVVRDIAMGSMRRTRSHNRLLAEIAGMDGAVVFDAEHILGFGCMIRSHDGVGSHAGARTTAAYSAFLHGGRPIKISADGEVTILFESRDPHGNACGAVIEFM